MDRTAEKRFGAVVWPGKPLLSQLHYGIMASESGQAAARTHTLHLYVRTSRKDVRKLLNALGATGPQTQGNRSSPAPLGLGP